MSVTSKNAVVVGAGLVGAVSALLLAQNGYRVTVVEQRSLRKKDAATLDPMSSKTIALSERSRLMLETADLWPDINCCSIKSVHVSELGKFGSVNIRADKLNMDALGFVVSNSEFELYLHQRMRNESAITLIEDAKAVSVEHSEEKVCLGIMQQGTQQSIDTDLLIAADGTESVVRALLQIDVQERDYNQCAVLANVMTSMPHSCTAYERFTGSGPLALLPQASSGKSHLYSMIFTAVEKDIQSLASMPDDCFLQLLQKRFGGKLGRFEKIGKRFVAPLKLVVSKNQTVGRCALIGNASRTLHPVAGQGLNLALRDVFELAACLSVEDIDVCEVLENFSTDRRFDQQLVTRQTDLLARAFTDKPFPLQLPASAARRMSLFLLDTVEPVKKSFATLNMGKHVSLPR